MVQCRPYAYAEDNPVDNADPTGLHICWGDQGRNPPPPGAIPGPNGRCGCGNGSGGSTGTANTGDGSSSAGTPSPCGYTASCGRNNTWPMPPRPSTTTVHSYTPADCVHLGACSVVISGTVTNYQNASEDGTLLEDWILGIDTDQYFDQWDPMTQNLMADSNQKAVIIKAASDLRNGKLSDSYHYNDGKGLLGHVKAFRQDGGGFFTGRSSGAHDYADAFLGSYDEYWHAVPTPTGQATLYITVTNKTDLNSLAHPDLFTGNHIRLIDGFHPLATSPSAFGPQYQTFQWQEETSY